MKNRTILQVPRELLTDLKGLKKHRRETYEDVLRRLVSKKHIKKKLQRVMEGKI